MKKKSVVALLTATMVIGMTGTGCGDNRAVGKRKIHAFTMH